MAKNGSIFSKIKTYINRYVVFPHDYQADVLTTWVIHTWAFEHARTTPYIYVHSPEKQSGKSLLIEVLSSVVQNPMGAIDMTGPVLFRAIETMQPTVMLDEVDAIWSGAKNEGLRGILNGGYKEGGHVWRLTNSEPVKFNTFSPKLLAGIHNGYLPDTLVDRCIPITLRRKPVSEKREPFYSLSNEQEIEQLLDEIDAWVQEHGESLDRFKLKPVEGLSDRESEIAWPLLAIAKEFGIEAQVANAIVEMITEYHEMNDETDEMLEMVHTIAQLFQEYDRPKIHTEEMLAGLGMQSTKSGAMQLSAYLDKYDISPHKVRVGTRVLQGYTLDQFVTLFDMHGIEVTLNGK